jgi:hypothetical protein
MLSDWVSLAEIDLQRRVVAVQTVSVLEPWPGLHALEDATQYGSIRFRAGRWVVDDLSICQVGASGPGHEVSFSSARQRDGFVHLFREKTWLYDPSDLLDAMAFVLRSSGMDEEALERWAWNTARTVMEVGLPPVFPSQFGAGQHLYLPHRMRPAEHRAFCTFLANRGSTLRG